MLEAPRRKESVSIAQLTCVCYYCCTHAPGPVLLHPAALVTEPLVVIVPPKPVYRKGTHNER